MSADKRKVSTDALETLGTIIGPGEKRDAIHLAVLPAEATHTLHPGDGISYTDGKATYDEKGIGIVDPFLTSPVLPGQMFWMVLRPRLITSLRHVWTHPALPDEPTAFVESEDPLRKAKSETWLRDFCYRGNCPPYQELISLMKGESSEDGYHSMSIDENYLHFSGTDASGEIPPEFWTHIEIVTGKTFEHRPEYFSCSC